MAADPAPLALGHLWVVGPGRVGLSLAALLHDAGALTRLTVSGRRPPPPDHPLFVGPAPAAGYRPGLTAPHPPPDLVVLAIPDDALPGVAAALADAAAAPGAVVLHTSGALDATVLAPLAAAGRATGSLHPLAAIADPVVGPERLRGAWWAAEGDPRAVAVGERIAAAADGRLLRLAPGGKTAYHTAAVFAANFLVALLALAERQMAAAGLPEAEARAALASLAAGALANVTESGPAAALTGPVSRGDAATVQRHLARLSGSERELYSLLAAEALLLAEHQGLDGVRADAIRRLLGGVR